MIERKRPREGKPRHKEFVPEKDDNFIPRLKECLKCDVEFLARTKWLFLCDPCKRYNEDKAKGCLFEVDYMDSSSAKQNAKKNPGG